MMIFDHSWGVRTTTGGTAECGLERAWRLKRILVARRRQRVGAPGRASEVARGTPDARLLAGSSPNSAITACRGLCEPILATEKARQKGVILAGASGVALILGDEIFYGQELTERIREAAGRENGAGHLDRNARARRRIGGLVRRARRIVSAQDPDLERAEESCRTPFRVQGVIRPSRRRPWQWARRVSGSPWGVSPARGPRMRRVCRVRRGGAHAAPRSAAILAGPGVQR
jgi:hypothetical protein